MRNIFLVGKHEIINTLSKRSFWFLSLIFPAFILGINVTMQMVTRDTFNNNQNGAANDGISAAPAVGMVDHSGIIQELPPGIPASVVPFFPDEQAAAAAVRAGQIERYYLIAEDYLESGQATLVARTIQPFDLMDDQFLSYILNYNLIGDQNLASTISAPTGQLQTESLAPESARDETQPFTFIGPFGIMFIFFFLITMTSGFMLQSVTREKENRVVEVLLSSLNPRQLMFGKILGLGLVGLLQVFIWLGAAYLVLGSGGQMFAAAAQFQLPPGFLGWGVLYFLAGFLTYASLMAAVGALSPTAREGGQFTFIALLPLMVPLWLNYIFIQYPNDPLAVFLSIFPLTAPTSMMTRMAATSVPTWQALLGLVLLAGTAYLFISLAARFFKSDNLLSDASLEWRRLISEFRRTPNR
jgi:ABC-2 type transport system permease protein